MLQVFRVEHRETRVGPFQSHTDFADELVAFADERQHLKLPQHDGLLMGEVPFCFVFGSPSLASLREWFLDREARPEHQQVVNALQAEGFVVAEFLVEPDQVRMGDSGLQLAFGADDAREEGLVVYHDMAMLLM